MTLTITGTPPLTIANPFLPLDPVERAGRRGNPLPGDGDVVQMRQSVEPSYIWGYNLNYYHDLLRYEYRVDNGSQDLPPDLILSGPALANTSCYRMHGTSNMPPYWTENLALCEEGTIEFSNDETVLAGAILRARVWAHPITPATYISLGESMVLNSTHLITQYMVVNDLFVDSLTSWDRSNPYFQRPSTILSVTPNTPAQANFNEPYQLSLTIENQADLSVSNVSLALPLTNTLAYVEGGTLNNNQLTWSIGTLTPDQSVVVTATVKATQGDIELIYPRYQVTADNGINESGSRLPSTTIGPAPQLEIVKYYLFGSQKVAVLQQFMDGTDEVSYIHGDHLGSTSLTTDDLGGLVSEVRYTPYGRERLASGDSPTDFGFTSQRNEASFGLMDYNARYYSPILGRFVSPDSIVPEPTRSGGYNRYRYARNSPLMYTDPTGHIPIETIWDIAALAYDVYAIATEGWTAENTAALTIDGIAAITPYAPAFGRASLEAGQVAVQTAARTVPMEARVAQGTMKVVQEADGSILNMSTGSGGTGSSQSWSQVGYGSTDLSQLAQQERIAQGWDTSVGNVAVFEYVEDGVIKTIVDRVVGPQNFNNHAEIRIIENLKNLGVDPSQVTRIYSELQPCRSCTRRISDLFSNAEVTYSYAHGMDSAVNAVSRQELEKNVNRLFGIDFLDLAGP